MNNVAVLAQGSNSTTSQSLPQWQIGSQDQSTECQIQQEQRSAQQQEQPLPGMELKQHESAAETQQHQSASQHELNHLQMPDERSQDECQQGQAQVSLQNPQTSGTQICQ
ncbi:hypothetical protein CJ030_MR1G018151 [Morella rubra]|uniref:Uncharacterized protein n=1 Tax=Morella rubra TaxID=262757 RepID=A0A6A1WML6_9ROSI|nr:hypothetical protein CJ030_MR1G018151 [Morella rubra]